MIRPLILTLLAAPALIAAEKTIEPGHFRIAKSFDATVLPAEPVVVSLEPEAWETFVIATIADHGSSVEKGAPILTFEHEDHARKIEDQKLAVEAQQLEVSTGELDLKKLEEEVALGLTEARRAKEIAEEDLAYFLETDGPAAETIARHRVEVATFQLKSAEEELRQLKAMYDEDDLTEETEEIILDRQKFLVEDAKLDLTNAKRTSAETIDTDLPRRQEKLERAAERAAIELAKAEKHLPDAVSKARIELAKAKLALERGTTELQRLEKDAELFEWKAPAGGVVIHGEIADGEWTLGELARNLRPGGAVPPHRGLVTFAPADGAVTTCATVDPALANVLQNGSPLAVTIPGREDLAIAATVRTVAPVADAKGKHQVVIDAQWPEDFVPSPAASVRCLAVIYEKDDAISVPSKALRADGKGGWSAEVKLADGSTVRREITRGRVDDETTEVRSGLEPGQVIIIPD